jgi:4-hydroxythreonine-4-phosphate dehydrogenase
VAAPIVITCGDPAGVGPEVIAAWMEAEPAAAAQTAIVGPCKWLNRLPHGLLLPVGLDDYEAVPGQPDPEGALVAWAALDRAAAGCRSGEFSAAVTGPISKERMAAIGWPHPGQTEYFAAKWGGRPTMGFCGGKLRVVLLTWHIPFRFVTHHLTQADFARTVAAADLLARRAGIAQPRIGVCGLNPHAGESGLLGSEEFEIIDPLLDGLRADYPGLSSTQPADTLFARHARGEFDVVIALYHDQGLAPLKLIDFDEAVNVTLGLSYIRTSPDHGTAYGIAGKGQARFTSFANAVDWARRLACVSEG